MVFGQISDILYYEVLDIPLSELQGLKSLNVTFHHAMKDEVKIVWLSTKFNVDPSNVMGQIFLQPNYIEQWKFCWLHLVIHFSFSVLEGGAIQPKCRAATTWGLLPQNLQGQTWGLLF